MHIFDAVALVAPALVPTSRFDRPTLVYDGVEILAYNGLVTARAPCDLDLDPFAVSGPLFQSLVKSTSRVSIGEHRVTIFNGKARYYVNQNPFAIARKSVPDRMGADGTVVPLTQEFVDAVTRVKEFVSDNAVHLWAMSVFVSKRGMIATNNIALAFAPFPNEVEFSMPSSMIADLHVGRQLVVSDTVVILYDKETGQWLQYHKLAQEAPAQLFTMIDTLVNGTISIEGLDEIVEALDKLPDATMASIENGEVAFTSEKHANRAEHPFDAALTFKMGVKGIRLLAKHATHVSDALCPSKLLFSGKDLRGILVARY